MMIGQKNLLNKLNNFTLNNLPHSMLLIGERGSEQDEVCDYIANKFGLDKIDLTETISKELIDLIYESHTPTLYTISMSKFDSKNQNIMLKLYEEPNEYSYIIIIAESEESVLDTIKTRSYKFNSDVYTRSDLFNLIQGKDDNETNLILNICTTPGQIETANHININLLYENCNETIKNLNRIKLYKLLKLSEQINFSDEYDKFDLYIYLKTLKYCIKEMLMTSVDKTSDYLVKLYAEVLGYTKTFEIVNSRLEGGRRFFENLLISMYNISLQYMGLDIK